MAKEKGTTVMIRLLKETLGEGISAKYFLFDSWFSNPRQLLDILGLKLHAIAMIKRSAKCYYEFEGKRMTVKQIFAACKKRRGRSKYLLSVPMKIHVKQEDVSEETAMAKIVCVRNRHNRKDWIALISTDMNLSEEEIIRLYRRRWDIEVFFKTCKSYLHLRSYHGLSYDALTAHVAFVFTRCMCFQWRKGTTKICALWVSFSFSRVTYFWLCNNSLQSFCAKSPFNGEMSVDFVLGCFVQRPSS